AAKEHALDVDGLRPAKIFQGRGLDVALERDAGAVDQYVEPAEGGDDALDHFTPARLVGDVLGEDEIGNAFEAGEAGFVAVGRRHSCALGVKQKRSRAADAGGRAGDERHLAFEASWSAWHVHPPSSNSLGAALFRPGSARRHA